MPNDHDAEQEGIPPLRRRTLAKGAKFDFVEAAFDAPTGTEIRRQYVQHPGAVVILPLLQTPQGPQVVFVRNRRVALGQFILELPAGTRDKPGEEPIAAAARELVEETGYSAATLTPLLRFYTGPGLTDEFMHAFFATDLSHVGQKLEADEQMSVRAIPVREALALIERGGLVDAKSIAVLLYANHCGLLGSTQD
jgi:ADP-ribose pyrophosphatase